MRVWIGILLLLVVAAGAAFGWQWVVEDPGYVLIRLRGTSIETTLVFSVVALLVSWALMSLAWRLLRWPARVWIRGQRKRARENLANGMAAFAEGRYQHAERLLAKAAKQPAVRGPAYLAMARAAHSRGDDAAAQTALDLAANDVVAAAFAQRAKFLSERGRHADVLALLKPKAAAGKLSPVGWNVLVEAALAESDAQAALDALPTLARTQSFSAAKMSELEGRVLVAALDSAASQARLNSLWSSVNRNQRKRPEVIAAFARRAAHFGQILAAMDEIESAQRREWNDSLSLTYSDLGPAELAMRTKHAEGWLSIAPNSTSLLTSLGRLCRDQKLWGKGIQYLLRAVQITESPIAWETLGDCYAGSGEEVLANRCYRNSLLNQRGQPAVPLQGHGSARIDTQALIFEERDQHGMPRLPKTG
ncbi:MAG TPA: heme biosynthesis HemY N-terminal domain-containing protein [Dokdonella sp.]|uniref:heme biosynthesis HemY N-terminal domain-containing protein n=1 Tax=Dokdonella sp. TaxID=2291710 RepID=UPI002D7E8B5C|nr:heme biosynthesis HemY N-terminal domain-containing protein [Dokdonella sp.]HET9034201.1 heme biosynthesis HemY N-terminal domain-containing protein [Dokdonella sp.]